MGSFGKRLPILKLYIVKEEKDMTVVKNVEKNYWEVQFYYKDWQGVQRKKHKRGFKTKREAVDWAEQFKLQQSKDLDMTFASFVDIYFEDMEKRLRETTIHNKRYIVELKILPYFGEKKIAEITAADVRKWQTELMDKKNGYAQTYLKTINNQLSAIMNYAVRFYDLPRNPCRQAGSMGKSSAEEMNFWTKEEFETFLEGIRDKPDSYIAFLLLYWTGIRLGELLALTFKDIDFENRILHITKSYQRIDRKDIISKPKTEKGKRDITLPDFLVEELREYTNHLYGYMEDDRIFQFTKYRLEHDMALGVKVTGVKKIRLHDIRHSHASLLISELQMPPLLVADHLGHEKIQTTLNTYSHLYPNQSRNLADQLNQIYKGDEDNVGKTERINN